MSASSGISRGGKLSGEGGGAAPSLEEKKAQRIKCPFKIPDRGDCDGSFGRGIDVRQHIMHDHAELRLVCECGGKFTTQFAYKRHRQGIHKNNPEQVPPAQLSGMKCCNFQFENANDLFHHILDQQHVLPTRENRRLLKVTASRTVGKSSAALTYSSLPGQPSAPSTSSLYGSTSQRIQQGSTVAAVTVPSFQNLPMVR